MGPSMSDIGNDKSGKQTLCVIPKKLAMTDAPVVIMSSMSAFPVSSNWRLGHGSGRWYGLDSGVGNCMGGESAKPWLGDDLDGNILDGVSTTIQIVNMPVGTMTDNIYLPFA